MKQREVGEAYEASTSALEAARGQRLSLRRAIAGLEEALAATDDPDGLGGQDGLGARLGPVLEQLQEGFAGHVSRHAIAESATAFDPEAVQALRDHTVRLFADLVRHRKRGLDLVYEAYHVDIGGES